MNVQNELLVLPLDRVIVPPDRLREVDPERAKSMAVSMAERGQITPIEVGPADADGNHTLIIGAHRLAAAKIAGLKTIRATVFDGDPRERRLREIDENLYRHELNPLDEMVFLAERRAIFEDLHGKVKPGRPNSRNLRQLSFFDDTTQRFGLSRPMIERSLSRFSKLADDVLLSLRRHPIARSGADLDALARLPVTEQRQVAAMLLSETNPTPNVRAAIRVLRGDASENLSPDRGLKSLCRAWSNATEADRRAFAQWLFKEGHLDGKGRDALLRGMGV